MKTASSYFAGAKNINASVLLKSIIEHPSLTAPIEPLINFTKHFPLFSGNILELHNDRNDQWFDFSFRINCLYDNLVLHSHNVPVYIQEGYRKIVDTSVNGFRFGIENIWFEYDFPYQCKPSLFFDVHRSTGRTVAKKFSDLEMLSQIFQYPCYPELEHFMIRLKESQLNVVFFGFMLSRNTTSIRLTVRGMQPYKMAEVLRRLGWDGNYDLLNYLQENYINAVHSLLLDVDFDDRLGHRIAIEIFNFNVDEMLKKFQSKGVYAQDQHDFLRTWPGINSLPSDVAALLTDRYHRRVDTLYRRINHFKFSLEGDVIKTKAYLYYCF